MSVSIGVGKYIVSSANWRRKFEVEDSPSYEDTLFEIATRGAEWALNNNKEIGIFINVQDLKDPDREFTVLSYKVLNNAGRFVLAELQRKSVKEDLNIDLADSTPLHKLIIKMHKASLRKAYCIAKITSTQTEDQKSKISIVCIDLGLFEDKISAKRKCKELNDSFNQKIFAVKKITYNL